MLYSNRLINLSSAQSVPQLQCTDHYSRQQRFPPGKRDRRSRRRHGFLAAGPLRIRPLPASDAGSTRQRYAFTIFVIAHGGERRLFAHLWTWQCDGQSPCSACVKKGFRDCLYDAANSRHELRQRADALAREVATLKAKGRAAPPAQGEHAAARLSDSPHSSFSSSSDNSRNLISPDPDLCVDSYQDYEAELQDGQVFASRVSEAPSIDPNLGDLATILSNLALTTTDAATRDGLMNLLQNCQNVQPAHVAVSLEGHSRAGGRLSSFSEPAVAPRDMNNGNSNQEIGAYDAAVPFLPMDGTDYPAAPASVLPYRTPVASSMPFPETAGYMRGFAPGRYSTYQRGARHETEGRNGYGNSAQSGRTDHVPSQTQTRLVSKRQPSLHGFMPFSSSIKANHYPRDVQDTQLANLGASQCAAETCWLPVECIPDGPAKWASNTFTGVRNRARWAIANGACAESLTRSTSLQNIVSDYKQRLVDPDYKRDPEQEMNVSDWAQAFVTWFPHLVRPNEAAQQQQQQMQMQMSMQMQMQQ